MMTKSFLAVLVLIAAPPLARAGVDADVSNFELHLSKVDSSLAGGDLRAAQLYLQSAQRDVDHADDADNRDPRFQKLKAKLPAYIKKVENAANEGAQEHEDSGPAYLADQQYRFGNYDVCITTLEQLFKTSPAAKSRPSYSNPDMTNEKLLAACKEAKVHADAAKLEQGKQKAAQLADNLGGAASKFSDGVDLLAKAKKLARGGGKWAAFDGYNLYRLSADALSEAERDFQNAIRDAAPVAQHVFVVGKSKTKMTGAEIVEAAKTSGSVARNERDALQARHDALQPLAERAYNSLPGARGKLSRQRGNPSFFDGPDDTVTEALASAARAPFWRYDSDGCKTTYYFNGNAIARVSHVPAGCAE